LIKGELQISLYFSVTLTN